MASGDESLVVRVNISQQEMEAFKVLAIRRHTTVPRALAALVRWSLKRDAETPEPQLQLASEGESRSARGNE